LWSIRSSSRRFVDIAFLLDRPRTRDWGAWSGRAGSYDRRSASWPWTPGSLSLD
jgi:hypothetical protein